MCAHSARRQRRAGVNGWRPVFARQRQSRCERRPSRDAGEGIGAYSSATLRLCKGREQA